MNFSQKKITVLLILFTILIFSCGDIIEGKISVRGNEPHTYLSIVTTNGNEFRIVGNLERRISEKYQGGTIKVRGIIIQKGIGPGLHFRIVDYR